MDKIAVLIPCFNESQTIEKVVSDWKRELPEAVIYVYDNNSSDNTADLATKAGAVVRHEYSQGKGNVIRRMFRLMLNVTSWLMEMIPIQRNTENKWQIWCSKKERIWW